MYKYSLLSMLNVACVYIFSDPTSWYWITNYSANP